MQNERIFGETKMRNSLSRITYIFQIGQLNKWLKFVVSIVFPRCHWPIAFLNVVVGTPTYSTFHKSVFFDAVMFRSSSLFGSGVNVEQILPCVFSRHLSI